MTRYIHSGKEKRRFVRAMFGEIAPRYDFLNRMFTAGMDVRWRKRLAAVLSVRPGERVLDLACGTGDAARQVARLQPHCLLLGADPLPAMLRRARGKLPGLIPVCCESESLPFRDNSFQAAAVAFGVRNFSCLEEGLRQIHRVLAPGGRVGILEFALPDRGRLRGFYRWYLTRALPFLGGLLSRGYAYQYLPESIRHFPAPGDFGDLLGSVGFTGVDTEQFLGGTVRIYCGWK